MKKIALLMAVLMIAACAVLAVSADDDVSVVRKHTPTVDGVLDEAYTESAVFELGNYDFWLYNLPDGVGTSAQGTRVYLLWDDDFIYVCAVVKDATPVSAEERWDIDYTSWILCDNVELYFFNSEGRNRSFIHFCCNGLGLSTKLTVTEGKSAVKNKDLDKYTIVGGVSEDGYIVEAAIPKDCVKFRLADGTEFLFGYQYNDHIIDDAVNAASSGCQSGDMMFSAVLSANTRKDPDTPDGPDHPDDPDDPDMPYTTDAGIAAAVIAMAAAAFVIFRKKR